MTTSSKSELRPSQPLRFRHPLQLREAATGFASRLAAVNNRGLTELLRHRGISPWDVDRGDENAIRFVAAIGSADPTQLLKQTIRPTDKDRRWEVAGESFGPNAINRTYFRYCPHCVLEDLQNTYGPEMARPWLRIEWTLNHYRACHRHHTFLVASAPTRRRFAPFDFNETMANLSPELQGIAATAEAYRVSPFHDWIIARLEGRKDPANWLDSLPLHVGATWCENLGISALHPPKVMPATLTTMDKAVAADEGYRIASAGVEPIRELFDRLANSERRTRGIVGPRDTYGYAYGMLAKTMDDAQFEPLRQLVRDMIRTALPWKLGTDLLGETITEHAVLTVRTAALAAGVDAKTIRKIFAKKGIAQQALDDGLRNHRVIAPVAQAFPVVEKLTDALTMPAAMKLLGIERRQIQAVVDAGALPYATGVERDEWEQHRFAREDIEAMMARLFDGAVEIHEPNDRQVDIPTARHIAGTTTVDVLKLIFDKRIGWKGRRAGRTDYMGLLLDADEVTRLVREDAPQFRNLRFCDVELVMPGLSQRSIQPLIDLDELVQTMEYSPNARREVTVVTAASVGAFRLKYVTAAELCQAHGLHHKQVKYRLLDAGVDMCFDQDAVKAMIYDRGRVEAATAANTGIWAK
ncbi:MAG: TniQ family protein [Devosia sp.]